MLVSKGLLDESYTFWKNSFQTQLESLCFRWYKFVPRGETGANSFTESDNKALKYDPMGPRANDGIDTAQSRIIKHTQRRINSLQRDAMNSLSQELVSRDTDTLLQETLNSLSKTLVHESIEIIQRKCVCIQNTMSEFEF